MTKKIDGAALLQESKDNVKKLKQQKEKQMKTTNQTIKTVLTVIVTLTAVASLVGAFYLGTQFQNNVNHEVTTQVKELATVISTKK